MSCRSVSLTYSCNNKLSGLSNEAKDFIERLLVVNPKRRLTANQALSHLWIRKHNRNSSFMDSLNSSELQLVPIEEKAMVVRRHGLEPTEQRVPVRDVSSRQRHRGSGRAAAGATNRRNPIRDPRPVAASGERVPSARRPNRRVFRREP